MRQITIYTTDNEYNEFVQLAKNLRYVKKVETDEGDNKTTIIKNLKTGFKEMELFKKGRLKTTGAEDFLSDL
jgi:hypothetical protein